MLWKKKHFNPVEEHLIVTHIRHAEKSCSGEIRLYVESKVIGGQLEARTIAVFKKLKMYKTLERNAVLIYIALDDRKFAVFGDEGIHQKLGFHFWTEKAAELQDKFKNGHVVPGVCAVIDEIGEALKAHFPHKIADDKNQLSDKPVYGK
jgi:uncharacterized membrane protein